MSRSGSAWLRERLLGGPSLPPDRLLVEPDLLRRRFLLAEVLAPPLSLRPSPAWLVRSAAPGSVPER